MPRPPVLILWISAVIGLLGFVTLAGGAWLLSLGGSFYYAAAGAALLVTAGLLWFRRAVALHVYAGLVIVTLIWAIAEIGFDWWQLVPRGDILFPLGLILVLPWVTRRLYAWGSVSAPSWRRAAGPLAIALAISGLVAVAAMLTSNDQTGRLPEVRRGVTANYGGVAEGDWTAYGRSWLGNKWSPLDQITRANVGRLEVAWHIHTGDLKRPGDPPETTYEVTPIKVDDTVYLCTPHNIVLALDPETGATRWRFDPHVRVSSQLQHLSCRGVSYHDGGASGAAAATAECQQRILMTTNDARLIALDAHTGAPCTDFGNKGQVDTLAGMPNLRRGWYQFTSAPLVVRDLVVLGGSIFDNKSIRMPSGVIRAYDVHDGHLVWNFDPGNPGDTSPIKPGQHYSLSSPNSWSTSAADEALGMIYIPMGMGAVDQWGGTRPATTEKFASTILALDIATGQVRWVFQTVHHDLWDMDVPAQPALVDLDIPGKGRVPALVQSTKTGNIFVLDRRDGKPLHPVDERPVPQGAAPGDRLSLTQPFSHVTLMPGMAHEHDMWGMTMLDQLSCRIAFRRLRYEGPFTPPSTQGTLVYPGNFGVMDWGGMAIDPERQIAFAHPNYMGFVDRLVPRPKADGDGKGPSSGSDLQGSDEHGYNPNRGAPFAVELNPFLSPLGLPCQAPPWGYVAGIDLTTGKVLYKRKNGTIEDQTALSLPFKLGVPTLGGPITTAGGLAFMSSSLDYYVRAYDVATGEVLWKARLPAGGQATPMTYRSPASGRQFVLVVAGGHGSLGTELGDSIIAYALPKD